MFDIGKKKIKPNILADVLLSDFIMNKDINSRFKLNTNWVLSPSFEDKVVLHKLALVLLALLALEDKNANFRHVREFLEKIVFSPDIVEGYPFVIEVKATMDQVSELLKSRNSGNGIHWAKAWLTQIGIDEPNPMTLVQFAMMWMDNYVAVTNYLKGYNPQ